MQFPTESFPLVSGHGYLYSPLDEASADIQRRRRFTKLGMITIFACAATIGVATLIRDNGIKAAHDNDHFFAGLLFDEKGFYFPMDPSAIASSIDGADHHSARSLRRRSLRASGAAGKDTAAEMDAAEPWQGPKWGYKWTPESMNTKKEFAAIGEYYHAKGLGIADYYRSKYDPTYKAGKAEPSTTTPTNATADASAPWTPDWQADKERGMAVGKKYATIGQHIADHYRQAFDPTYKSNEEDIGRRMLKSKLKKRKEEDKKKKKDDVPFYDWQADRDRGIAIGQEFRELGLEIASHYMDDDLSPKEWHKYRDEALALAKHYQNKADTIQQFYEKKYGSIAMDMEGMALLPVLPRGETSSESTHSWGIDPSENRQHALEIRRARIERGKSIRNYYRSVFDPTFGCGNEKQDATIVDSGSQAVLRNPDLDFPPWGQDPKADRAHGSALGEYWAQKGKDTGKYWDKKGSELHEYYEDKYLSMFASKYKYTTAAEP